MFGNVMEWTWAPGEEAILEPKILVARGTLDDVFKMALHQRDSLEK